MKAIYLFFLLAFFVSAPATLAQELDTCTILRSELPSDTQTHIRNRQERIENLTGLLEELTQGNVDEDMIYEFMYWATMADSAAFKSSDIEYPKCSEYETLDSVFENLISDVYQLSVHASLLFQGRLSDFQRENVLELVRERSDEIFIGLEIWNTLYTEVNS